MPLFVDMFCVCVNTHPLWASKDSNSKLRRFPQLFNDPTNERLPSTIRLAIKITYCKRKRVAWGKRLYDILWFQQQGFMQLKRWGIFLLCQKDLGRPFVSTLLQCFEELGLRREVTRLFWGERGQEEEEEEEEEEEMKEEWGGLSHIWRPEMEQNSMSNIWNSNCIM